MIGSSGKAKKGEDRAAVLDANIHGERVMFGLVADGHGGKEIAVQCAEELLPWVVKHAADGSGGSLNAAVVAAFRHMHEKACAIADCIAGTTLTVAALNVPRREVSAWNVGDSLAMLVHEGGYEVLSQSHRLDDSIAEQERVQQLGAKLGRAMDAQGQPGGPLRCWPGGLAGARRFMRVRFMHLARLMRVRTCSSAMRARRVCTAHARFACIACITSPSRETIEAPAPARAHGHIHIPLMHPHPPPLPSPALPSPARPGSDAHHRRLRLQGVRLV